MLANHDSAFLIRMDAHKTHSTLISNEPSAAATTAWSVHLHAAVTQTRRGRPPPGPLRDETRRARRAPAHSADSSERLRRRPRAPPVSGTPGSPHPQGLTQTHAPFHKASRVCRETFPILSTYDVLTCVRLL